MICPWLKITTNHKTAVEDTEYEEFNACYEEDCPWYVPEHNEGSLIVSEGCMRATTENNLSKAVKNGNYRG